MTYDPTIARDHRLWRRIPGWHFVWDANRNAVRPSSAAFDNDPDGNKSGDQKIDYVSKALDEVAAGKPVTQAQSKPYGCSVKYAK